MKTARIELHVTAFVHLGEDLSQALPPENAPFHHEEDAVTRVQSMYVHDNEALQAYVQSATAAALESIKDTLPAKLAHGASKLQGAE